MYVVVVMLTREIDGATVKYVPYWTMDPSAAGLSPYAFGGISIPVSASPTSHGPV